MKNEKDILTNQMWDENDDIATLIDTMLNMPGLSKTYAKDPKCNWILLIGNENITDGISSMPEIEQEIIKQFFLDKLTIIDISHNLGLTPELLYGHITAIKVRLRSYV